MRTAIIGLPQVGKTSLFTILTGAAGETRIGSTKVSVGVTKVPDPRLEALAAIFNPPKITPATIEFADMPALSKDALRDASYIASLRMVDAFAHVIRLFDSDTVMHVDGEIDPKRDWQNIETELIINDLQVVEKRMERVDKDRKRQKSPELDKEYDLLVRCKDALESEQPLRELEIDADDEKRLRGFQFLSEKPVLLVLNLGEEQASSLHQIEEKYQQEWLGGKKRCAVTAICGSVEAEIAQLDAKEAQEFLAGYGLTEPGVQRLARATYALLDLMSFLTAGETEVRAWTIPVNTTAVKAAGAIHSDFEKKFIRAEAIHWEKLIHHKGYAGARQAGELRLEAKDYIVQEGDVFVIRHS